MHTPWGTFLSLTCSFCWMTTLACDPTPDSKTEPNAEFSSTPLVASSISDAGHYVIDLFTAPEQPPSAGSVAVQLRITTTASSAVDESLQVTLVPIMPAMGHGTSDVPTAEAKGAGRYVFPSVDLFMPGRWDLVTDIAGAQPDTITLAVDVR